MVFASLRRTASTLIHPSLSDFASRRSFAIAFDIDGVLLRGSQPIEGAAHALRLLYQDVTNPSHARIPFIFLTNGGGVQEFVKARELSTLLGVKVLPQQVLLGHTPFKSLVDRSRNAHILAVGKGEPANIMTNYGYQSVVSMEEYVLHFNDIDPLAKYKCWPSIQDGDRTRDTQMNQMVPRLVEAVFVTSDPVDWGRDIQVLCDVLRSGGFPGKRSACQPPIFFAADDFEYQAAFPVERLGMGAFRMALENIYNRISDKPLVYTSFGKPKVAVFRNAEIALQMVAKALEAGLQSSSLAENFYESIKVHSHNSQGKQVEFESIYMIGDNPATDILGATQAGRPWFTILTRTGCFKGKVNHALYPADLVVDSVQEAIHFILKRHSDDGLSQSK